MTLIQSGQVFRIYVNPGTDDDGYVDWSYVGRRAFEGEPARVYAFRFGSREVERMREIAERNPPRNAPT